MTVKHSKHFAAFPFGAIVCSILIQSCLHWSNVACDLIPSGSGSGSDSKPNLDIPNGPVRPPSVAWDQRTQLAQSPNYASQHWFHHFVIILFGYSTVIVPVLAIVYMVKHNVCPLSVCNQTLVKIFVYGKQHLVVEDEIEAQLLADSDADERKKCESGHRKHTSGSKSWHSLLFCFVGLQVSYLTWGVLQEKIMTTDYTVYRHVIQTSEHDNQNTVQVKPQIIQFQDSQFLVLVNRILAFNFALVAIWIQHRQSASSPQVLNHKSYVIAPLYEFLYCSLSNVLSSWCQYEALKFVNFPTQVLSKACKLLAVMLMSQVINKKKYKNIEYVFASLITIGMTLFLLGNRSIASHDVITHHHDNHRTYDLLDGLIILGAYVTFDAFTSNWQGKLFDKYAISSCQMMAAVNFYSILLTVTSAAEQGDLWPNIGLLARCPVLLFDCFLLSVCSAAGQLFVFHTISTFGPLVFTTIMTLRQALAILLSCLIYKHPLSPLSSLGVLLVFGALFYQIHWKRTSSSARRMGK